LENFQYFFLQNSARPGLISLKSLALAGDGTPVYTSAQERKTRTCSCLETAGKDAISESRYSTFEWMQVPFSSPVVGILIVPSTSSKEGYAS